MALELLGVNLCAISVAAVCVIRYLRVFNEQNKTGLPNRTLFLLGVWIVTLLIQCRFLIYLSALALRVDAGN